MDGVSAAAVECLLFRLTLLHFFLFFSIWYVLSLGCRGQWTGDRL